MTGLTTRPMTPAGMMTARGKPREVKFTLAQINPRVGDLRGNLAKIIRYARAAEDESSDVVIFPELALSGYPPEDLLLRDDFLAQCGRALGELQAAVRGIVVVVGHPLAENGNLFNALSVLENGTVRACYRKRLLPNYAVFDEKRYFHAGQEAAVVEIKGLAVGLTICEDLWQPNPMKQSAALGAELIIAINASPFHNAQAFRREQEVVLKRAREHQLPIIYLNQVGGQDELVFDGSSLVVDGMGKVAARLPAFSEAMQTVAFQRAAGHGTAGHGPAGYGKFAPSQIEPQLEGAELIYRAVVLGVRDYIQKNGFQGAVLGLSGGIDSALSLAIVVDAIGAARVMAVMMPSRHTSAMSLEDARTEADTLGVRYEVISIEPIYAAAQAQLAPQLATHDAGATDATEENATEQNITEQNITEQNVQARCRGMLLMALSNRFGYLVLTTGNKSEMAVGYATLYGDMVGGFSAIKDVPKMMVYQLARYRNGISPVIPERVLNRPPSAELAPNQKDEDSLPPYEILDPILESFVENDHSAAQIIAAGYDPETVHTIIALVVANEYKRRQAAPGVRVTSRAFGKDRRYPMTSGFFRSQDFGEEVLGSED